MALIHSQVDLSRLPKPAVIEALDYEAIFAAMLADLTARDSNFSALVESDPAYIILEVAAYREMLLRQRVNEACYGVMLAYATGADLEQIGARYDVARLQITPEDNTTIPPTPAVWESDDDYRARIQLSLEGYTTAGSIGSYVFHAKSASGDVADVCVQRLIPGRVSIAILSRTGDGTASAELLSTVTSALNDETVRPLCDTVAVEGAQIVNYTIAATLYVYPGVGADEVIEHARQAIAAWTLTQRRLNRNITRSGIYAALHQAGVQNVVLTSPPASLTIEWNQAANCTAINVTLGGIDE